MRDWTLAYEGYDPAKEGLREALCALGNGYLITRGAAADASAGNGHYPGTYLAGGYNRAQSVINDRTIENEDLVNFPNWLVFQIAIEDGPWLAPHTVSYLDYRQELDLLGGTLIRELRFKDDQERIVHWHEQRLVSMDDPHMAGLEVTLTAEGWSGRLRVRWAIDGSVINAGVARYRALNSQHIETVDRSIVDDTYLFLKSRTIQSRLEVAMATKLIVSGAPLALSENHLEQDVVSRIDSINAESGHPVRFEKVLAVYTSRDAAVSECGIAAIERLRASEDGFDKLLSGHKKAWQTLWNASDLRLNVPGDHAQMKLRVHLFHLLQTLSPHTAQLDTGAPARGWHGEAYRGHIFWDEMFILPPVSFRMPEVTRNLLMYRYRRLAEARRAARRVGLRGAMFPWQSGSDGREESQQIHLNPKSGRWVPDNTWRQRHVGAAIAFNTWAYFVVTDDKEFFQNYGVELIIEIARFWASLTDFNDQTGRYHIKGVVGPDEFHTAYPDVEIEAGLDDNAYTNVLAAWVLGVASDILDQAPEQQRQELCDKLDLLEDEIASFDDISRKLYIPFVNETVIAQFAGYDDLEEIDWEDYRTRYGDIHRLDRLLEAEGKSPNKYKAGKQADTLMLFFLFSADELRQIFERLGYRMDVDTIGDTIDYYARRTSHGSTLSWVVHSWVLARRDRISSWKLFSQALDSDIEDVQGGTTPEGIHLGAMTGTVDIIQRCYLGLEPSLHALTVNPRLPDELESIETRILFHGQRLDMVVDHERLQIQAADFSPNPVTIIYRGNVRILKPNDRCVIRLVKPLQVH